MARTGQGPQSSQVGAQRWRVSPCTHPLMIWVKPRGVWWLISAKFKIALTERWQVSSCFSCLWSLVFQCVPILRQTHRPFWACTDPWPLGKRGNWAPQGIPSEVAFCLSVFWSHNPARGWERIGFIQTQDWWWQGCPCGSHQKKEATRQGCRLTAVPRSLPWLCDKCQRSKQLRCVPCSSAGQKSWSRGPTSSSPDPDAVTTTS